MSKEVIGRIIEKDLKVRTEISHPEKTPSELGIDCVAFRDFA